MATLRAFLAALVLTLHFLFANAQVSRIFHCPCSFHISRPLDKSGLTNQETFDFVVQKLFKTSPPVDSSYTVRSVTLSHAVSTELYQVFEHLSIPETGTFHVSIKHHSSGRGLAPDYRLTLKPTSRSEGVCPIAFPFDHPIGVESPPRIPLRQLGIAAVRGQYIVRQSDDTQTVTLNVVGGRLANSNLRRYLVQLTTRVNCSDGTFRCVSLCTGTLIHARWILTAAHCTLIEGETFVFVNTPRDVSGAFATAIKVHRHPLYNDFDINTSTHDIAAVKLSKNVIRACTKNVTACNGGVPAVMRVNVLASTPAEDQYTRLLGYGVRGFNDEVQDGLLRQVDIPVHNFKACKTFFAEEGVVVQDKFQICSGYRTNPDLCGACFGDSGGPSIAYANGTSGPEPVLVGIVSFGINCTSTFVNVRVSAFKKWIKSVGITSFKKNKIPLPEFAPTCPKGHFLFGTFGRCQTCQKNAISNPPAITCIECPNNLERDTSKGNMCSCRRIEDYRQVGTGTSARCVPCKVGKTSKIGSNKCS